jgi:hypothetical protein
MSLDYSKIISNLGDDLVAKTGEQVGLDRDQSVRVAHALAANFSKGREEAVRQTAEDTGLTEEVVSAMLSKLIETGAKKLVEEGPVGDAVASAQAAASNAMKKAAGGMFGSIFGSKTS